MSKRNAMLNISTQALDTIKTAPANITATPRLFENTFIKGTVEKGKSANVNFYGVTIGKLKIISGQLIPCDPGHIDEYGIPFMQVFPNGEFPVQLSIANVGGEETIAFARVNFSDAPVVKWEFALQKRQTQLPIEGEEMHGYSTDLSAVIFMGAESSKVLDKSNLTDSEANLYKQMDKHYRNDWKYAIYDFCNHN